MFGVGRHPELALLHSHNAVYTHEARHAVLGTAHIFFVMQLIPDPRAAVIAVVLQKDPSYFNEQILAIGPPLTYRPLFVRVIPAP